MSGLRLGVPVGAGRGGPEVMSTWSGQDGAGRERSRGGQVEEGGAVGVEGEAGKEKAVQGFGSQPRSVSGGELAVITGSGRIILRSVGSEGGSGSGRRRLGELFATLFEVGEIAIGCEIESEELRGVSDA